MQSSLRDPSSPSCLSIVAGFSFGARARREKAIWQPSPVEPVFLPDSLSGCPRLSDVVPESLRHYLENIQSMTKNKAEIENLQPLTAANWDPVLKRIRAKRMKLLARLLGIGLLRPRPMGTANYFLGVFFVDKKDKKQKRLILDARLVNWAFVSPH